MNNAYGDNSFLIRSSSAFNGDGMLKSNGNLDFALVPKFLGQ
ncbi:hypothetical protein [Staphylococcus coagulans]|nr:hypothetical protein [Staphylococcus coagulans]